ncbi:MAG: hypothetical protein HY305_07415 [Sphingobacteriales bacterium]|nr:hypothetical protein [Sphingobacteriales bacterium]
MKWRLISNEQAILQEYDLMNNENCEVVLKYNAKHQSVRLTAGTQQRLFFLETGSQLSNKMIFRNEYTMEIGNIVYDKFNKESGVITIDTTQYQFRLHHSFPSFVIYNKGEEQPIISCELISDLKNEGINNNTLLLGVCWYLGLPETKEKLTGRLIPQQPAHY